MKRIWLILLALSMALLLCACSSGDGSYQAERNGIQYTVSPWDGTITDGEHTYRYEFSGNSETYDFAVTYPDGSSYWWDQSGASGHGGWSDDYDAAAYVDGDILCGLVLSGRPRQVNVGKMAAAIVVIGLGVFQAVRPCTAWFLAYGWRFRDAEPSDAALILTRVGGIAAAVIGIILLLS